MCIIKYNISRINSTDLIVILQHDEKDQYAGEGEKIKDGDLGEGCNENTCLFSISLLNIN